MTPRKIDVSQLKSAIRRLSVLVLGLACGSAMAQDMPLAELLIPGEEWQVVADGLKFAEGPTCDRGGNVYFSDTLDNKIFKIDAIGKLSPFVANSLRTYGLMVGPGEKLFGCRTGTKEIVAFDARGEATTIASEIVANDLVVTREGTIYCTDPDNKQVWRVDPKGNKSVVDTGIERPNGIILWPDQRTLVVADTAGRHLWTFRVEADGSLSHKQPYYTMLLEPGRSGSGADGMTVDTQGRLYVCTNMGLQVFDTQGRLSGIIAKPQPGKFLSNVSFGGPKLDSLYVTNTDRVYRRRVSATGVRYFE